jgi:transposase
MELKELYNIKETATILGVSRNTVYSWRDEGKLQQVLKGITLKRPFITADSIQAVLQDAGYTLEGRVKEIEEGNSKPVQVAA